MNTILIPLLALAAILGVESSPTLDSPTAASAAPSAVKTLSFLLSGSNIPTQDDSTDNDAYVYAYELPPAGEKVLIGTTEIVSDNNSPAWDTVLTFGYKKGTGQKIKLEVWDKDLLSGSDEAGEVVLNLDDFVAKNENVTLPLSKGGYLSVVGTQPLKFTLYAKNIPAKDKASGEKVAVISESNKKILSDAFATISWRREKNGTDNLIGLTSVIYNSDDPVWPETFEFNHYQPGTNQHLYFRLEDYDRFNKNEFIGDVLVDADTYASKRAKHVVKLENTSINTAILAINPVQN